MNGFDVIRRTDEIRSFDANFTTSNVAREVLVAITKLAADIFPARKIQSGEIVIPKSRFDAARAIHAIRDDGSPGAIEKVLKDLNELFPFVRPIRTQNSYTLRNHDLDPNEPLGRMQIKVRENLKKRSDA